MAPEHSSSNNPYVGPRTFSYEQRHLFFGREREARDLLARVLSERLLLFYAQSGAGKSSLLRTRLIPQLEEKGFVVLPVGRVGGELPATVTQVDNVFACNLMLSIDEGGDPVRLAHVRLTDFLAHLARRTVTTLPGETHKGWVFDATLTPAAAEPGTRRYALVIDQFEEIFTTHPTHWEHRKDFFRQLDQAILDDPNLWVVLTLREDYVASLDPYAPLLSDRLRGRFYMERLGIDAARAAIRSPAELGNRPFAAGVAEKLVDDLRQVRVPGQDQPVPGQYVEPVQLQVVCYQLWERLGAGGQGLRVGGQGLGVGAEITEADLAAAGDVNQALEQFYSDTVAAVLAEPAVQAAGVTERALRTWFDQELITETGLRSTVLRNEPGGRTGSLSNVAVDALGRRFLLRTELRGGGAWVELVHDRFVEPIRSNNRAWLEKNQNPLTAAAAAWQLAGKPIGRLLRGEQLKMAQAEVAAQPGGFSALERDFVAASVEAERSAASRRQQTVIWITAALVVVFAALTVWALYQSVQARDARDAAIVAQHREKTARDQAEANAAAAILAQNREKAARDQAEANAATAVAERSIAQAASTAAAGSLATQEANLMGQLTAVVAPNDTPTPTTTPSSTAGITPSPTRPPQITPETPRVYRVRPGDTLLSIARANNLSTSSLLRLNPGLNVNTLRAGDAIFLPAVSSTPVPTPTPTASGPYPLNPTVIAQQTQLAAVRATQTVIARSIATATPTPAPVVCTTDPSGEFSDVWKKYKDRLGCPVQLQPIDSGAFAEQQFERGFMLWSQSPREPNGTMLVLARGNRPTWFEPRDWSFVADGSICAGQFTPPAGRFLPIRGFGGVWCDNPQIREALGWGLEAERGVGAAVQEFDNGFIIRTGDLSRAYVLLRNDRSYIEERRP